jgi:hypothetical protein
MEREKTMKISAPLFFKVRVDEEKYVLELGKDDVLLGRGTGPNENEGNVRFRMLVSKVLNIADSSNSHYQKMTKDKLAALVFDTIKNRNGRFLRKLSKAEAGCIRVEQIKLSNKNKSASNDLYIIVSDEIAINKTKQSFRHQHRVLQRNHKPDILVIGSATKANNNKIKISPMIKSSGYISKFHEALLSHPRKIATSGTSVSNYLLGNPANLPWLPVDALSTVGMQRRLLNESASSLSIIGMQERFSNKAAAVALSRETNRHVESLLSLENSRRVQSLAIMLQTRMGK